LSPPFLVDFSIPARGSRPFVKASFPFPCKQLLPQFYYNDPLTPSPGFFIPLYRSKCFFKFDSSFNPHAALCRDSCYPSSLFFSAPPFFPLSRPLWPPPTPSRFVLIIVFFFPPCSAQKNLFYLLTLRRVSAFYSFFP